MESPYTATKPNDGTQASEDSWPSSSDVALLAFAVLGGLLFLPLIALPVAWFGTFGTLMLRSALIGQRPDKIARMVIGSLFLSLGVFYTLFFVLFFG